jgi:hypothetical protein
MKRKAIQQPFSCELPNDIWIVIVQNCMALHRIGLLLSIFATCRAAIHWIMPSLHGFFELWKLSKSLLYEKCSNKAYTPLLYFALQWLYDSRLLSQADANQEAIEKKKFGLVSEVLFAIQFSLLKDDSLGELPVHFLPSLQNVASHRIYYFSKDASRIKALKNHSSLYEIDLKSASALWQSLPEKTKSPKKKLLLQYIVKQKTPRSNRKLSYTLLQKYIPHKKASRHTKFRNLVLKEKKKGKKNGEGVLLQDHPLENRMFYLTRNHTYRDIKACSGRILYTLNSHNTKRSISNGLTSYLFGRT